MGKPTSTVSQVHVTGPLAAFAPAFKSKLKDLGYTPLTTVNEMRLMAYLSRWLDAEALTVADLTKDRTEWFLHARRAAGYTSACSRHSLTTLLEVLGGQGVLPADQPTAPGSTMEVLLDSFEGFLLHERALAPSTAAAYVDRARRFVAVCAADGVLTDLVAKDVTDAVLRESAAVSVGSAQYFVAALRSFLRFCFVEGLTPSDLSAAALAVTGRRRSPLPRGISRTDTEALLESCDRRRLDGRRDYAILTTLLRLGLRASEVAGLTLDDIDWRAAEIVVHGKGGRQDRLPLPTDVGEAIVGYLRRGRPQDRPAGSVPESAGAGRGSGTRRSVLGGATRLQASGHGAGRGASAAPHDGLPNGQGWSAPARDQPGAPPSQHREHRYLRQDRRRWAPDPGPALAGRFGTMTDPARHVQDYLRLRRALGFKLRRHGEVLPQLVAYLDAAGAATLTIELAVSWARLPQAVHPSTWAGGLVWNCP